MFEINREKNKATSGSTRPSIKFDIRAGTALPPHKAEQALAEFDQDFLPPVPYDEEKEAALISSAKILIRNKEYVLAQNLLRSVLATNPSSYSAVYWTGFCLRADKKFNDAIRCFKSLVEIRKDLLSLNELAETFYLAGHDQQALDCYLDALREIQDESPILFDIHKNIGNIYVRLGDFEAAEENYNKANTIHPNSDVLLVNYGTLEIQRGNIQQALERFRQAIYINPKNDKAWVGLALVHREFGDADLSCGNLETALDLQPYNKTALQIIAEWGARDGKYDSAIDHLKKYLEKYDQDAEMSFLLLRLLIAAKKFDQARLEAERIENLNPDYPGLFELIRSLPERHAMEISE